MYKPEGTGAQTQPGQTLPGNVAGGGTGET